jgi:hypothetical protein
MHRLRRADVMKINQCSQFASFDRANRPNLYGFQISKGDAAQLPDIGEA